MKRLLLLSSLLLNGCIYYQYPYPYYGRSYHPPPSYGYHPPSGGSYLPPTSYQTPPAPTPYGQQPPSYSGSYQEPPPPPASGYQSGAAVYPDQQPPQTNGPINLNPPVQQQPLPAPENPPPSQGP